MSYPHNTLFFLTDLQMCGIVRCPPEEGRETDDRADSIDLHEYHKITDYQTRCNDTRPSVHLPSVTRQYDFYHSCASRDGYHTTHSGATLNPQLEMCRTDIFS